MVGRRDSAPKLPKRSKSDGSAESISSETSESETSYFTE